MNKNFKSQNENNSKNPKIAKEEKSNTIQKFTDEIVENIPDEPTINPPEELLEDEEELNHLIKSREKEVEIIEEDTFPEPMEYLPTQQELDEQFEEEYGHYSDEEFEADLSIKEIDKQECMSYYGGCSRLEDPEERVCEDYFDEEDFEVEERYLEEFVVPDDFLDNVVIEEEPVIELPEEIANEEKEIEELIKSEKSNNS